MIAKANVNTNNINNSQSGFDKNSRELQRSSHGDTAELLEAAENLERENQVFFLI